MRVFFDELEKIASIVSKGKAIMKIIKGTPKPPPTIGKSIRSGLKQGAMWSGGFALLDHTTKQPHLSLDTPKQKTKRLAKNLGIGAAGFGTWMGIENALNRSGKWAAKKVNPSTSRVSKGLHKFLKGGKNLGRVGKFGRGAAIFGGTMLAADQVEKFLRKRAKVSKPKELYLRDLR